MADLRLIIIFIVHKLSRSQVVTNIKVHCIYSHIYCSNVHIKLNNTEYWAKFVLILKK